MMTSAERWAELAHGLAIPQEILDAVDESPWGFAPGLFSGRADDAMTSRPDTPSDAAARAVVRDGATILDVGCGAGAAALRFARERVSFTGLDPSTELLDEFETRASSAGRPLTRVESIWPAEVAIHDLVLCHHVAYNVADIVPFVRALVDAARDLVVIELTTRHPLDWLRPLWQALHGWDAPAGPTADLLTDVIVEMGVAATREDWTRPHEPMLAGHDGLRRRLCLPADRERDLSELLVTCPVPTEQNVTTFVITT